MAFKYKLVKETEIGSTKDVRSFPVANPKTLADMGAKVDKETFRDFLKEPANSSRSIRLEADIINSLEMVGFDQFEIEEFMDFIYLTRNRFMGGGKYGEKPLNEKEEGYYKDPKTGKLTQGSFEKGWKALINRIKDEEGNINPDAKNTLKEMIVAELKKRKKYVS
jgi:hypothetical protein